MKQSPRVLRGALVAAAGLAFFVATVGVPLPVGRTKDRSIPFPCMDRTCGCHDAAGCKAHCCCFSSEEKLAWAAEREVDPTPFVEDAALISLAGERRRSLLPPDCRHKSVATCCSRDTIESAGQPIAQNGLQTSEHASQPSDDVVSIAAYRQCNGLQPLWTLLNAALPPPDAVRCEFELLVSGRVADMGVSLTFVAFSPPTPPPRA
ncbi:MAG: hypothetical protein ACREHD_25195 [Pirellulales bacterium]